MPDGYVLRNADLARTARTLAAEGPSALYAGAIGRAVSATVRRPVVAAGAPFTVLLGTWAPQPSPPYTTGARQPTKVTYRGLDVYGVGPSSSGASTVREALNVLSGHDPGGQLLAQSTFSYLEVSRLAFADRNAYVGDIDDEDVPLRNLRSPASAAPRRCLIGSRHSPRRSTPATPTRRVTHRAVSLHRPVRNATRPITGDGRHVGKCDQLRQHIEQIASSGMTVTGYGFPVNNEMTDVDFAPSAPGVDDPNLPAPGTRLGSSMSPTIALRDGRPARAIGTPGGAPIITAVLQVLLAHVDLGISLPDAIAAPRAPQRNAAVTRAELSLSDTSLRRELTSRYGERFSRLPDGGFIGNATGPVFCLMGASKRPPIRSVGAAARRWS